MVHNNIKPRFSQRVRGFVQQFGWDLHKYYKPNYKWLYDMNIKTVLDIGANAGQFALRTHKMLPQTKVISFEPISRIYKELAENVKPINGVALNMALGEREYKTEINVSEHTESSSLLKMADKHKQNFTHTANHTKETISVKRLDDVFPTLQTEPNYLIKIDVQGFEDKVIAGGQETLKKAKVLFMEVEFQELYEKQPLFDDIYGLLKGLGFSYAGNFEQMNSGIDGLPLFADAIFLRK